MLVERSVSVAKIVLLRKIFVGTDEINRHRGMVATLLLSLSPPLPNALGAKGAQIECID